MKDKRKLKNGLKLSTQAPIIHTSHKEVASKFDSVHRRSIGISNCLFKVYILFAVIYFNDYLDNDSLHPLSSNLNISQDDENLLEFPSGCIILNREKVAKYIDKLVELPNAGPPNQSIGSFDQYLSEDRFHELAEILIDREIL